MHPQAPAALTGFDDTWNPRKESALLGDQMCRHGFSFIKPKDHTPRLVVPVRPCGTCTGRERMWDGRVPPRVPFEWMFRL